MTKETLSSRGIPFEIQWGDIGDPDAAVVELEKKGYPRDGVMHVRTFIDHDRPYKAPERDPKAFEMYIRGVYVRNDGAEIAPKVMLQSLVEHLERWSGAVGYHGLCILEAGQLPPLTAGFEMERCVSLAFDCCQSLSHQYLVPLPQWLLCAAMAGLFPDFANFRTFPEVVSRIMLSHFKPRDFTIRHAAAADADAVCVLEARCRPIELRTPRAVLEKRLKERAKLNFALEQGGKLLGVAFFQYVDDVPTLVNDTKWKARDKLAIPESQGTHLMLLDIFADELADSTLKGRVAAELRDFLLCYARALSANVSEICGVVRASDFKTAKKVGDGSYEDYCFTNNGAHDPGLAFHVKAGAKIHAVIDNWWPEDVENDGNGVFMSYVVGAPNSNSKLP